MLERLRLREGWSSLLLLLLVLLTMAWSFEAGGLSEGLRILPSVVMLGVLVGFASAKSRLPGILAHPLGLAVGAVFCFLLLSTLILVPPDVHSAGAGSPGWAATVQIKGQILIERMEAWLSAALHAETNADPLPFVVQMAALSWLLAFYGAWFLFRSHWVWGAVLPGGLAIFLSVYYAPPRLLVYFMLYLFWALVLVVRTNVYAHESEWQRHHVVYDQYIGLEFLRDGALISLAVVALIWLIPRPNIPGRLGEHWQGLQSPWQRVQEEWNRLYASLSYREQTGMASFGRTLTLGGAVNLGSTPILEVQAPEARYWRAVLLDRYTGLGWVDTSPSTVHFGAGAPLTYWAAYQARKVMVQTVTMMRRGEPLLFAAAEPLQLHAAARAQVNAAAEEEDGPAALPFEVSAIYTPDLGRDNRYLVRSMVSTASVRGLRAAGADYPKWVRERYLQLPESLPPRISALAHEVAGSKATPFEQAVAIESYLRGIRYSQAIDSPPAGQDPVDWFLFENKEGYCTYFASAMVLMCRTLGLPARFAQGYAPGEYVAEKKAFVVREADAHAWPEVFFPGYGWTEFEPTPSQPPLVRPSGEEEPEAGASPDLPGGEHGLGEEFGPDLPLPPLDELGDVTLPRQRTLFQRALWFELLTAGLLVALATGLGWRFGRRWRALRRIERLYLRLTWVSGLLGVSAHPFQTPLEFGRSLAAALGSRGDLAGQIVGLYVRDRYGCRRATDEELAAAGGAWHRLRLFVFGQAFRRRLSRWRIGARGDRERQSWTELRPR